MSFPLARQNALDKLYPDYNYGQLLSAPNNILGIEYLKALHRLSSNIEPITIRREVSHYHDTKLQEQFSSASALRSTIADGDFAKLYGQIPCECMPSLEDGYEVRYPMCADDFSLLLKYKLLNETASSLVDYADVSEELANRICNRLNDYVSFEQFCELLKTKEITYTRISRALIHILLGVKKSDYVEIEYARVLGFRSLSSVLLSELKKSSSIPLLTKLGKDETLSDSARNMIEIDLFASNLYESVVTNKFKTPFINELQHAIIKI
jgi:predicted nucleotidyltransferase